MGWVQDSGLAGPLLCTRPPPWGPPRAPRQHSGGCGPSLGLRPRAGQHPPRLLWSDSGEQARTSREPWLSPAGCAAWDTWQSLEIVWLSPRLCWLPVAVRTTYHKLSVSNKFMNHEFCRSPNWVLLGQEQNVGWAIFLLEASPAPEAAHIPGLEAPSSAFKASSTASVLRFLLHF